MIGTVPAKRKTWTARRSDEVAMQVWRVIANAGPRGIGASDACERLNGMDSDLLKVHLRDLQRNGHVQFNGTNRWGAWRATGLLPKDEPGPMWLRNIDPEPDDDKPTPQQAATKADQVLAAARWVPNSAFALGAQAAGFGVDIDAVHMPAEHKAAMVAPIDPAPESIVSFEFPTKPLAEAPAPAIEPEPELIPGLDADRAEADAAMAPGDHFSLFTLTEGPLFALRSDHRLLVLRQSGDKLLFSPDETRALFRYLDGLMAIGHGSLSEATS